MDEGYTSSYPLFYDTVCTDVHHKHYFIESLNMNATCNNKWQKDNSNANQKNKLIRKENYDSNPN